MLFAFAGMRKLNRCAEKSQMDTSAWF